MEGFFKKLVGFLHDILAPVAKKLADPQARAQFNESLGFQPNPNAPEPNFPDGSAMDRYLKNEQKNQEALLFTQSLQEVALIIDALKGMFRAGAETYYAIKPGDSNRAERIDMAITELVTLTLNIFTLDYIRLRHPTLHNVFKIMGVIDEMGQRAGSDGALMKVLGDYFKNFGKGFALSDEKSVHTAIEAIGLGLNVLKFMLFKDTPIFFSPGFETYSKSLTKHADQASKGILSLGMFFEKDELIQGNVLLTFGPIPRTRFGGGFFAKVNAPAVFEKKFSDFLALQVEAEGDLDFFYAKDMGFDVQAGKANRAAVIVKGTPTPKNLSLLKGPELSIGYDDEHSLELRFSRDDIGIIAKTEVNIKFGRGDAKAFPFGFIPESQFEETIPLQFGWTNKRSWFFGDAGTIGANPQETEENNNSRASRDVGNPNDEAASKPNLFFFNVPIRASFLGLSFQNVHLGLGKDGDTTIFETSLDFTFVIGKVFNLAVTRLGARGYITPRDDSKGFLGQDIDLDFKTPTGIGISVDIGLLKGGGFLSLDDEKGEYFGALELEVDLSCIVFTLKAFGIIQTKLPNGGEDDYSLFVVISSEFEPIPLIFGLTLNGVGGLFGHNRGADISLIQTEMRSPSLENILFLKDPIANISRIVTDSGRYFPVEQNKSLFGISLKIGYGKPTIFELSLAVIFVKPEKKVLIPGFMRLETPKASKILSLKINFLAVLDREEGYFFFRADLVDSKFATFKLTGSLVFATGWGASDGLLAISIGGFHPAYKHFPEIKALPNAFRGMDRLRISLWETGENHLYLEAYIAFTSNSRQFGAHAYLHVEGPMGFNIDGHLGIDVLWETEPVCFFEANLEARIDFRHGTDILAGVGLTALFTGPSPKHIEGKARLKICWFLTVSIPFSKTWGDTVETPTVEEADLLQIFLKQIEDDRNWRAEIPNFHHLHVSLRNDPDRAIGEIVLQPLGAILFSQREFPLNQDIQKIGVRKPKGLKRVTIENISSNGLAFTHRTPLQELFAAGQFIELKDDEKLARPSFERMEGGLRLGDTAISKYPAPFIKAKDADYELAYIVPDLPAKKAEKKVLSPHQFQVFTRQSSVAKSKLSWQAGRGLNTAPKTVGYKDSKFAIAGTEDLKLFKNADGIGYQAKSQTEAEQIKTRIISENPALEGKLQVVASYELIN